MLSFKRLFKIMEGSKLLYVVAFLATFGVVICTTLTPYVMKITVDSAINGDPIDAPAFIVNFIERLGGVGVLGRNIWICSLSIVLISILEGIFSYTRGSATAMASEDMAKKLKNNLFTHLQKLPYEYHVKAQTGDLIQRCTSDVDTIRRFLSGQLVEISRTIFMIIILGIVIFSVDVKMSLISIAIMPFMLFFSYFFFKRVKNAFKKGDEKEGELSATLQENLSGVRVVRAFGRQKYEKNKFLVKNTEYKDLSYKVTLIMASFWSLTDAICMLQTGAVLISGIYFTYKGEISLGTFFLFNSYSGMLLWPIRNLGRILSDMGKMQVSLGRVYEILNTPEEADTPGAGTPALRGNIEFSHVTFEYEKNKPVLKDVSFSIKAGETIAILGTTGSGKSTIMHILLRLYGYSGGSIKINGNELNMINKKWLRERIGIVLQESFLFSKTIKENVKMAKDVVEDTEVFDAARIASIHDDISGFENGYDTMVGEKGITLSGGQKQRVAIARTLVKNSDVLIFDDSLSAVDTDTDAQIRAALKERSKDVTTFIISQRITTLMEADRIFVIENGKLTDAGNHEDLINREGLYSRIWKIQTMIEEDFDNEAV